jgi:hypothetical protein
MGRAIKNRFPCISKSEAEEFPNLKEPRIKIARSKEQKMNNFDLTKDHSKLYFRDENNKIPSTVAITNELTRIGNKRLQTIQVARIDFP